VVNPLGGNLWHPQLRANCLKLRLLLRGQERIIVGDIPWFVRRDDEKIVIATFSGGQANDIACDGSGGRRIAKGLNRDLRVVIAADDKTLVHWMYPVVRREAHEESLISRDD